MIEHIIFDFGGVLLELDPDATWTALEECLGLESLDDPGLQQVFIDFEVGKITEAEFLTSVASFSTRPTNQKEILSAWNAMLGPLPAHRLEMLERLSKSYHLHLLSNTNSAHIDYVYGYLKETYDITDFGQEYFSSHYFSHILHQRKPNRDIYESVISAIGTTPELAMFIDDNKANAMAANDIGIRGIHHDPNSDLADVIDGYILSASGS